jgi:hypothetical protein
MPRYLHPIGSVEPDCVDKNGHDWQSPEVLVGKSPDNPATWTFQDGPVFHQACVRCGCGRRIYQLKRYFPGEFHVGDNHGRAAKPVINDVETMVNMILSVDEDTRNILGRNRGA